VHTFKLVTTPGKKGAITEDAMSLVEVGPRLCLQPIRIFAGSFGGSVLYENPGYVSPNQVGLGFGPLDHQHSSTGLLQGLQVEHD
jgi:ribosome biogenesis protein BRX1